MNEWISQTTQTGVFMKNSLFLWPRLFVRSLVIYPYSPYINKNNQANNNNSSNKDKEYDDDEDGDEDKGKWDNLYVVTIYLSSHHFKFVS